MAYEKRHMFYILFEVVLLTSTVAGAPELSDVHVSGSIEYYCYQFVQYVLTHT